jgi:hypothetical protein
MYSLEVRKEGREGGREGWVVEQWRLCLTAWDMVVVGGEGGREGAREGERM